MSKRQSSQVNSSANRKTTTWMLTEAARSQCKHVDIVTTSQQNLKQLKSMAKPIKSTLKVPNTTNPNPNPNPKTTTTTTATLLSHFHPMGNVVFCPRIPSIAPTTSSSSSFDITRLIRNRKPLARFKWTFNASCFILVLIQFIVAICNQPNVVVYAQTTTTTTTGSNLGANENSVGLQPVASESNTLTSSAASNAASCFGGLQIFEKISMSSFENPTTGANSAGGFVNGVLIQQDDQALTSECLNICRSQSNCLSFVIDYNKFECKSYATTQQELQQELESKFQHSRSLNETILVGSSSSRAQTGNSSGADPTSAGDQPQASASTMHVANHLLPSASSNYFEKICLDGIANRNQFSDICGQGRLWAIERVVDSFLDGYVEKEITNVNSKDECSKLCLFEAQFVCRSADYDQRSRLCRLSKEDRRSQPQAMRSVAGSNRHYLENQCSTTGPSTCVYETKKNLGIISMDALKFAQSVQDCQMKCNQETTFNCRSYSFHQQRCFLSGDDSSSLNSNLIKLPQRTGWLFGEKKCLVELCSKGVFTYEKTTGYTLRSALATPIDLMLMPSGSSINFALLDPSSASNIDDLDKLDPQESSRLQQHHFLPLFNPRQMNATTSSSLSSLIGFNGGSTQTQNTEHLQTSAAAAAAAAAGLDPLQNDASTPRQRRSGSGSSNNLAITQQCRNSCDLGYLNCPAFTVDYKNNRCQRLDRNSQGRHNDLVPRDAFSYYEKICLRVPEIMSMCQDKFWIFERVVGYELAPHLYEKSLKFVQSRRDCEEYCLEEKQFQCRSALYNDETSDCKLSTYDRRLANQVGGYYRNFNARISYLENQCIRDQGTNKKQLQCYYEQTRDEPSYPTFTERIEMVPVASTGSSSSSSSGSASLRASDSTMTSMASHSGAMRHENSANISSFGVSYCKQLCNSNENFECHSFGYYASTAQCFLSGDDSTSAGELASSPSTGFTYFEKKCRYYSANDSMSIPDPYSYGMDQRGPNSNIDTPTQMEPQNPYVQPVPTRKNNTSDHNMYSPMNPPSGNISIVNIDPASNGKQFPMQQPSFATKPDGSASSNDSAANSSGPDGYKCGLAHTFVYQRISGFEPIGGYLTLLIRDNNRPGIVADCAQLCKHAYECRAFVVDYNSNQCFAMLENSSVGLLSLRQTIGKDYFEGFCVPDHLLLSANSCANKTWIIDKIVDQAVVGVQHQKLIPNSDRVQCRQACLEERLFYCKSAMFDGANSECKLYSIDRESVPQMRLIFTRGVDFFENQCQISSNSCPYDAIERDMTMVTTTKSTQARSTFECENACNTELSFNCRSYTYMDQNPSLPNLCLLSSDSRSTSQRGSVREQQRTLYAERNCYFRRPRFPGSGGGSGQSYQQTTNSIVAPTQPSTEVSVDVHDPYQVSPHYKPPNPVPISDPYGGTRTQESGGLSEPIAGPAPGQACELHQYTFERTFGYDFRLAPKERAPIAPTVAIAIACQQECLKRDRCKSFVVEYSFPYQSCFLIDAQVGANKKLLVKATNSAYFEKICLPRAGVEVPEVPSAPNAPQTHAPLYDTARLYDSLNGPITTAYSGAESWSHHGHSSGNQIPYYMQQQQLVQNYPSRSCAKLWSFERFVNHNFTIQSDKIIENILTRMQCQTLCLNEASFSCRSGTYDYSNNICRLFKNTRRTIMSQFVDLESPISTSPSESGRSNAQQPSTLPTGTVQVIRGSTEIESLASSSSNHEPTSSELTPAKRQAESRQLTIQTAEPSASHKNIDYFENTCIPEPSSCQYRQMYDLFSPFIDKVTHAVSLSDCQRQCDLERLFSCKSINYEPGNRNCMLINEDLISLSRGSRQSQALLSRRGSVYSEKGNCEMINVQCTSQEMLVSINFDSPFRGRIMAKGNPEQCFLLGDGQTNIQFPIVFGPKCNSRQEGHNTFTNEILIQQHPVIMTESDKTVRIMCAFEAPEQTITLNNPTSRDNKTGIDVATSESGRTRNDKQQFSSIVSSKAPPPNVLLRILDFNGRDASMTNLGDDLVLKIQMQMDGRNSALSIFARNLVARSSNGESLLLIDNDGCPVDPNVFPALELDPKDGKSLYTAFKAFRFPSSGLVNFEVQIRFCPEKCQPIECHRGQNMKSYGKRKRRDVSSSLDAAPAPVPVALGRTSVFQSVDSQAQLGSLSTLMKPGKAFQYVREIMLPKQAVSPSEVTSPPDVEPDTTTDNRVYDNQDSDSSTDPTSQASEQGSATDVVSPQAQSEDNQTLSDRAKQNTADANHEDIDPQSTPKPMPEPTEEKILAPSFSAGIRSPIGSINNHIGNGFHSQHLTSLAPYGRLPVSVADYERQNVFIDASRMANGFRNQLSLKNDALEGIENNDQQHRKYTQHNSVKEAQSPSDQISQKDTNTQNTASDDGREMKGFAGSFSNGVTEPGLAGGKDVPLKFSILVGEKQPPASEGWNPSGPPVMVMNSSDVDLDHIVVPGKGGQLDLASTNDSRNTIATSADAAGMISNSTPDIFNRRPFESSATRSVYEQALDEVGGLVNRESVNGVGVGVGGDRDRNRKLSTRSNGLATSESAASYDCQLDTGRSKLWTIIWTGTLVIVINICLVILSLLLYFRRVNTSKNHNIMFGSPDCGPDQATHHRRYRWPSVLLKSKNDLGTSLNTHEHFFCKLNAKSQPSANLANNITNDYNWTNTSSSQSTISSMVSQIPVTSIKINQTRLNRYPFDIQPSVRNNFGIARQPTDLNESSNSYEGNSNHGYSCKLDE